jgi:serine O-acetyltransferase
VPVIGNNVYIGPGARIIGNIIVGDNVIIGANAVVVKDVSPYSVVAGVPAKIIAYITEQNWQSKYYGYGVKKPDG